jgi:hypothetical protein
LEEETARRERESWEEADRRIREEAIRAREEKARKLREREEMWTAMLDGRDQELKDEIRKSVQGTSGK